MSKEQRTEAFSVTVEEAVALILEHTKAITDIEQAALLSCGGRILAQDQQAGFDNPPFDRSPIDGYACRSEDLKNASKESPVRLKVIEEVDAGQYSKRMVQKGEAVRIMTGAAVPAGCDCCVRQEDTDYGEDIVSIYKSEIAWGNYCFQGEDFKQGTTLLKQGTSLGYVEIGVLAGMGCDLVPVFRKPKVALLTTGDEVTDPGKPLLPGKIYNSNQSMLAARMMEFGIQPCWIESVQDDPQVMTGRLKQISKEADLIITTGAVSVGKKDIMHEALKRAGAERIFWKVQIKPGMPTLFTVLNDIPVVSLSGNPFGVAVTVEVLIRPLLQKMMQDDALQLIRVQGVMADPFEKPGRARRMVRAYWENGKFHMPNGLHSNGVLSSMTGCNCLLDLPAGSPPLKPGDLAEAILL